jgi:RHS repeat-associated protein
LYGSGRIGLAQVNASQTNYVYELADHLGNVRATVQKESNGSLKLVSAADYYPFGMIMPNRATTPGEYRFGYQGQFAEKDEETGYNQFELRLWDGRLGRWLTTDPYGQFHSPYLGMGNSPLMGVDPDGGDWYTNRITGKQKAFEGSGFVFGYKRNLEGAYQLPDLNAIGRRMAVFRQWTPNLFQEWDLFLESETKTGEDFTKKLLLNLTCKTYDDMWVWTTRNFTSNARHISGFLANDNEVRDAGVSSVTTIGSAGLGAYFKGMQGFKFGMNTFRGILVRNSSRHITKTCRKTMLNRHNMKADQNENIMREFDSFMNEIGNIDKSNKSR